MTPPKHGTVIGVFEKPSHAQEAANELRRLGFREDQIGVAARESDTISGATMLNETAVNAAAGVATGAAAGAGLGALWGIGIAAGVLPGIGPAIAGGTLAVIISSALAGATVAGIAGALVGLGIPEDEASFYESEFKAGKVILSVKADHRYDEAAAILRKHGAYDIGRRPTQTEPQAHVVKGPVEPMGAPAPNLNVTEPGPDVYIPTSAVDVENPPTSRHEPARIDVTGDGEIRVPVREDEVKDETVTGRKTKAGPTKRRSKKS